MKNQTEKTSAKVVLVKGKLSPADNNELVTILQGKGRGILCLAKAQRDAANKAEGVQVVKSLHGLGVKMAQAEGRLQTAENNVFTSFREYAKVALPVLVSKVARVAAIEDIYKCFGEARKPAAVQRVTMLNNMATIAHGKAATRDTPAQPAQGEKAVIVILAKVASLPELKAALVEAKSATHGATGKAKTDPCVAKAATKAQPNADTIKAAEVVIPSQRAEAMKAACRMLSFISTHFLTMSSDGELIRELGDVTKKLKKAA